MGTLIGVLSATPVVLILFGLMLNCVTVADGPDAYARVQATASLCFVLAALIAALTWKSRNLFASSVTALVVLGGLLVGVGQSISSLAINACYVDTRAPERRGP